MALVQPGDRVTADGRWFRDGNRRCGIVRTIRWGDPNARHLWQRQTAVIVDFTTPKGGRTYPYDMSFEALEKIEEPTRPTAEQLAEEAGWQTFEARWAQLMQTSNG